MAFEPTGGPSGPAALRQEVAALHPAAYAWALACCGRVREDAEDVLQDSYRKIMTGKAKYAGRSAFKTWLFGVIRYTAREHRRRRFLRQMGLDRLREESPCSDARAPDEDAHVSGRAATLGRALTELARRQREVLHLVFYQDLSIQEAAAAMGVSLGTARRHYHRGKARLLRVLEKEGVAL